MVHESETGRSPFNNSLSNEIYVKITNLRSCILTYYGIKALWHSA